MTGESLFLDRLDQELAKVAKPDEHLDLYILGRSALVLHYGFALSTQDVDIVSRREADLEKTAVQLFGKGTALAQELGLYLDLVAPGVPPLPAWFKTRSTRMQGTWKVIRVWQLEVHDLAATKLKSFRPQDREDIQALCDRGLIHAGALRASLENAFTLRSPKVDEGEDDPDEPDCSRAFAHLRRVEAYLDGRIGSL
jgi:hypothetical protein